MVSQLALADMERYNVVPVCGTCDFWDHYEGLCRVNEFPTAVSMSCDEWELD